MTTTPTCEPTLADLARQAAELLERLEDNRRLLIDLPVEDRERLLRAVAQLHNPDPLARRQKQKAAGPEPAANTREIGDRSYLPMR